METTTCPFCLSKKIKVIYGFSKLFSLASYCLCESCGAQGPKVTGMNSEKKARELWNKRPDSFYTVIEKLKKQDLTVTGRFKEELPITTGSLKRSL
jgi:Lar family restriction alleviation protein